MYVQTISLHMLLVQVISQLEQRRCGQLRLSAAEMQLLGEARAQLRLVQRLAQQGDAFAARAQLREVSQLVCSMYHHMPYASS